MANVIQVVNSLEGEQAVPTFTYSLPVKSGTVSSVLPGYLVIKDGGNAGYVKAAPNATASTSVVLGIACSTSSETAAADGTVDIITAPTLTVALKAKTPGNLTAAMPFAVYILDVTAGSYTLNQGTTVNGIFRLISYDNTTNGNCIATLSTNW